MADGPVEMKDVGSFGEQTLLGPAVATYTPADPKFGFEQDEITAMRKTVIRLLGNPSGVPKLQVTADRGQRRLPRVTGVITVDIQLSGGLALLQGSDPNAIATQVADEAFAVVRKYLQVCIGVTESEDITLDRTGLGKWAGLTLMNAAGAIFEHRYVWVTPPASQFMSAAGVASRYPHSVNSLRTGHPIDQVVRWRVLAKRQINLAHDYQAAAVSANTSSEILVWALLRTIEQDLIRSGDPNGELPAVSNVVKQGKNLTAAIQKVGTLLDQSPWTVPQAVQSSSGGPSELTTYWNDAYPLRNRVVHAGYEPTFSEIERAYLATEQLWTKFQEIVAKRAADYPGTALMLLGKQDLAWRGLLSPQVSAAIDGAAAAHPNGPWNAAPPASSAPAP